MTLTNVFVYGTLRPGYPNHHVVADYVLDALDATAPDLQLLAPRHGHYPYAQPKPGACTIGTLLLIDPDQWPTARERLDWLEGYNAETDRGHYLRRTIRVSSAAGELPAWVYIAGRLPARVTPVPGNEWRTPALTR